MAAASHQTGNEAIDSAAKNHIATVRLGRYFGTLAGCNGVPLYSSHYFWPTPRLQCNINGRNITSWHRPELAMRFRLFVLLVALIACVSARSDAATTNLPANGSVEIFGDLSQFPDYLADSPAFENIETRVDTRAPLPATLSLFAGGLGVLGLFGWRRKCRAIFQNVCVFLEKQGPSLIVALGIMTTIVWIAILTSFPLRLIASVF